MAKFALLGVAFLLLNGAAAPHALSAAPELLILRGTTTRSLTELSVYLTPGGAARARICGAPEEFGSCSRPWNVKRRLLSAKELAVLSRLAREASLFTGRANGLELDFAFSTLEVHARPDVAILITSVNPSFTEPGARKELLKKLMALEDELSPD